MRKVSKIFGASAALLTALSVCGCAAYSSELNAPGASADRGHYRKDTGGTEGGDLLGGAGGMLTEAFDGGAAADALFSAEASAAVPETRRPGGDRSVIKPQSGLLTGGEWNDNEHWTDWKELYNSRSDWELFQSRWKDDRRNRLSVTVTSEGGQPVEGAKVTAPNGGTAVTDNKGRAYLFFEGAVDLELSVTCDGYLDAAMNVDWADPDTDNTIGVELKGEGAKSNKKLDLMIMCDTTGSMSDELEYLKAELDDIVKTVKAKNANIPTRISVNFYRDEGDEYVVRQFPFSGNIDEVTKTLGAQSAAGGGDFPEAVHSALKSAVDGHDWDDDSVKIMFLVLDAPPHDDDLIIGEVNEYTAKAAENGIRIIPIASSGIDKSTEYLLRVMAQVTGGTYTFLTNDSGVGGDHIEPTVGAFNVEKLKDMMIRIVSGYLE